MKAKELFELLKPHFKEKDLKYEELRFEFFPEWDRDNITIEDFHTCYSGRSSDTRALIIEFDPNTGNIKEFGLD
jgi:hypothetical protein